MKTQRVITTIALLYAVLVSIVLNVGPLIRCSVIGSSHLINTPQLIHSKVQYFHPSPHTVLLCAVTKDEEGYIDEWTDYHLALGFTGIMIFDNSIANDLRKRRSKVRYGDEKIEIIAWAGDGEKMIAYDDCLRRAVVQNYTWVAFFDVSEFLILRRHKDVMSVLHEHCKSGVLGVNRYFFGDGANSAEPLTRRFNMREPVLDKHVKLILRLSRQTLQKYRTFHEGFYHDTDNKSFSGGVNPDGPVNVAVIHHYLVKIPWRPCEKSLNLLTSVCADDYDKRVFSHEDSSAWSELTKRMPLYSFYDDFYAKKSRLPKIQSHSMENAVSLCTVVKDEAIYLDEWTDYHLSLGFSDIIIYDNSEDNNLRQLRQNRRLGDERIEIVRWTGDAQQLSAFTDCAERCRGRQRRWAAFFDVDEFLILRKHDNILSLLVEHCSSGALSVNWYIFGTNGHAAYSPEPVTRRFSMRAGHVIDGVKSIVELSDWKGFENPHFPILLRGKQKDTDNHSFFGPSNENGPMDIASLYHYWSKSEKEFSWKTCIKGRVDVHRNSTLHKADCVGRNLNVSLFRHFDNTAWMEVVRRVPQYSTFDKFYEQDFGQ